MLGSRPRHDPSTHCNQTLMLKSRDENEGTCCSGEGGEKPAGSETLDLSYIMGGRRRKKKKNSAKIIIDGISEKKRKGVARVIKIRARSPLCLQPIIRRAIEILLL